MGHLWILYYAVMYQISGGKALFCRGLFFRCWQLDYITDQDPYGIPDGPVPRALLAPCFARRLRTMYAGCFSWCPLCTRWAAKKQSVEEMEPLEVSRFTLRNLTDIYPRPETAGRSTSGHPSDSVWQETIYGTGIR